MYRMDGWRSTSGRAPPRASPRRSLAAASVFWNGPMGVFELEPFAHGTRTVAEALADSPGCTIAGGGETVQALR